MPTKKQDPVIAVVNYFQEAELPLARQTLEMAKAIVRRREPKLAQAVARSHKATKKDPAAVAG